MFSEPAAPKILKTNQFYFLLSQDCVACNIQVVKIRQSMLQAAEPKDNREFHNVNCRFCGAVHSVNWACISVLSQVIHNVTERKTVQTNMISFVSHGAGILTIMEASAEHDCCSEAQRNARRTRTSYFVCTVFLFHYIKWLPCERTLISALHNL